MGKVPSHQPPAVPGLPAHFPSPALARPAHHWACRCQVGAFSSALLCRGRAGCFLSEPFSTASAIPASGTNAAHFSVSEHGRQSGLCTFVALHREARTKRHFRYFKKCHRRLFCTQCCSSGLCFHCLGKAQQENT